MRVTCISTSGASLPASCLDERAGITTTTEFPLTVGVTYVVYGVTTFHGHCWYYVMDDNRLAYPVWKLAPLFEIADPSLAVDWVIGYARRDQSDEGFPIVSFPEWALDHSFYERLVEGDRDAVATFEARRLAAEADPQAR